MVRQESDALVVGQVLGGRYTILEKLGEGGMAEVYKARCSVLNRIVAVKVLRPQFAGDEDFVERFRREGQAAASLSHPNVVSIYDVGQDGDKHYIVMEYVRGLTLKEIIRREGALDPGIAAWIAREICYALEHAHRNNIVHRDIKPHNILVTHDGIVKVADFGIARAASTKTITETGTVIGTVSYFSPEQARGAPVSFQSDIYSLGVVLYEMLSGRVPFRGESPIAIAIQHIQEVPAPVRAIRPEVPEGLERVVMKSLEKDPARRFKTAGDMARALEPFVTAPDSLKEEDLPTAILPGPVTGFQKAEPPGETMVKKGFQRRPSHRWAFILSIVALLVAGAIWGLAKIPEFLYVPEVQVPDLSGKSVEEAKLALLELQLNMDQVETRYDDVVPPNHVISQRPPAGTRVKVNTPVHVVVSQGKEMVAVPDLYGLDLREARIALEDAGLVVGAQSEDYSPDVAPGKVMAQVPQAGQRVEKGLPVDITISKGPIPPGVAVPAVVGMELDAARRMVEDSGLTVGSVIEKADSTRPDGTVLQQYPEPGSELRPGGSIDLVVARSGGSAGPASDAAVKPTVSWVTVTVPPGKTSQEVIIKVNDYYGEREVYRSLHSPGERVEQHVVGYGNDIRIRVFIDGVLFKDETVMPRR
ncbi:MAG TPA: Stk1 family PASTA domain-containing Ser/Thr kinase [Firmicutes bacterium]|nr:Stk1 family PASTA domain-containing Ser/Thr kinase [Bacillota bacterium]